MRQALAAVRDGGLLVITNLDRLARPLPDPRDSIEALKKKNVKLAAAKAYFPSPRKPSCSPYTGEGSTPPPRPPSHE